VAPLTRFQETFSECASAVLTEKVDHLRGKTTGKIFERRIKRVRFHIPNEIFRHGRWFVPLQTDGDHRHRRLPNRLRWHCSMLTVQVSAKKSFSARCPKG
jgi:hypothetical protein